MPFLSDTFSCEGSYDCAGTLTLHPNPRQTLGLAGEATVPRLHPLFSAKFHLRKMNEHVTYPAPPEQSSFLARPSGDDHVHPLEILRFGRRYALTIATCFVSGTLLAGLYVGSIEPTYKARTQMLIEPKSLPLMEAQPREVKVSLDTAELESQMTVLRSGKIAMMVIGDLDLQDDAEFQDDPPPRFVVLADTILEWMLKLQLLDEAGVQLWRTGILDWIGADDGESEKEPLSEAERLQIAQESFERRLGVSRAGMSYVIEITFSSHDPDKAALIANAIAESYTREQVQSKLAAAQQGNIWLEQRLGELRGQLNEATQAVQSFRATHDYRIPMLDEARAAGAPMAREATTLEELETKATTYRTMYESVLQAFTASMQHQSYPYSVMRVITPALPPMLKSQPRGNLILAFGGLLGMLLGVGLAFGRHISDRSIRSAAQATKELGVNCIAEVPRIGGASSRLRLRHAYEMPNSPFSQRLRKLKAVATMIRGSGTDSRRVIGITSALPGEGKTVIASNLAILSTLSGCRTLVVDANVAGRTITREFAGRGGGAVIDTHSDDEPLRSKIVELPGLFDLLPATAGRSAGQGSGGATPFPKLLNQISEEYDLTIVDLPAGLTDDQLLVYRSLMHGVIVIAQSGRTSADDVLELIQSLRLARVAITCVVLTQV